MDFSYTPEQLALRERARALTEELMVYELPCEEQGGLEAQDLARIRELTLEARLNAINMPSEWGGQGLSTLDQVIVQEQLGQLTGALWDAVWRPANALAHCDQD
jgi:acyl-CoA dehydrogenase